MKDTIPSIAISVVMFAAVHCVSLLDIPVWSRLIAEIVTGIAVYVSLAALFRFQAWTEVWEVLKKILLVKNR